MHRQSESLSRAERESLRVALESKRAELLRARGENLAVATHAEETFPDPMDAATRATEEAELLSLASQERALIGAIDRALGKLADGTYGVSELEWSPHPHRAAARRAVGAAHGRRGRAARAATLKRRARASVRG